MKHWRLCEAKRPIYYWSPCCRIRPLTCWMRSGAGSPEKYHVPPNIVELEKKIEDVKNEKNKSGEEPKIWRSSLLARHRKRLGEELDAARQSGKKKANINGIDRRGADSWGGKHDDRDPGEKDGAGWKWKSFAKWPMIWRDGGRADGSYTKSR